MRAVVLGSLLVVGLGIVAVGAGLERADTAPQRALRAQVQSTLANAEMIAVSADVGDKYQQLTLIDPKQRVISVYHIEFATGAVALRSVRNFQYDQQLMHFNGKDPLPEHIKSLLSSR